MNKILIDRSTVEQALLLLELVSQAAREKFGVPLEVVDTLHSALAEPQEPDAYGYASRIAVAIWEKHYKYTAPQWKPLDDLVGVLSQISNMAAGLTLQQAQPVQEPVAWMYDCGGGGRMYAEVLDGVPGWTPLYTAPPHRKPLTEKQINHILDDVLEGGSLEDVARAVEAVHGIKE